MKVVVFGGSGFLGSYVVEELLKRDYEVVVADIYKSEYIDEKIYKKVNILDLENVKRIIDKNVDYVYNFAGMSNLDEAIHYPVKTFELNIIGNMNILEVCKEQNIKRFIYASSAYALSKDGSFYGLSKQTSEKVIEEYQKRFNLDYTIIRYGSIYSERASHNNYIYNLIKKALTEGILEYKGDGEDIREYIHAADAAKLSVDIIESDEYKNSHIILTGIEKLKRKDLLVMINEIFGNKLKIKNTEPEYFGHYKITPYSYQHPTPAKKLIANPYIDMGQGLLECIKTIENEKWRMENE